MIARACRLAGGAALLWPVCLAASASELTAAAAVAVGLIVAATLWRAGAGLMVLVALAPAGALFAPAPAHGGDLLAWSFLAAWLLAVWRPLAPSGWPAGIATPALLLMTCALASWVGVSIVGAAGVAPERLPLLLWRLLPADYLLFSTPAAETPAMLQAAAGLAVFMAALAMVRAQPGLAGFLVRAVVASLTLLALATVVRIWSDWAANSYGRWLVDRYVNDLAASRFSVPLKDLNAAGSLYALGFLAAATLAASDIRRRWMWAAAAAVMLPALWVTGSRTGLFAAAATSVGALIAWRARGWTRGRARLAAVSAAIALVVAAVITLALSSGSITGVGSASSALAMRTQFTRTSMRMFASAPVYGVGIGQYHARSTEFMPESLRAVYRNENAHNYFAQAFAELGIIGGGLFLWLLGVVLWRAARGAPVEDDDGATIALLTGCLAYALTCVAGHPLLVAEAALPFWAALGALGAAAPDAPSSSWRRPAVVGICAVLVVGIAGSVRVYLDREDRPRAIGLYARQTAQDGTSFSWTTRHVVLAGGRTPGFVRLVLRAPDRDTTRPFIVETWVGGRVVDRVEVTRERWLVREIPVQGVASTPFRRIDVQINQAWMPRGTPNAPDPPTYGVMAAELRWAGPGSR